MIATIRGRLSEVHPLIAIIEVNGFGYEVHVPITTMEHLPPVGDGVHLYIHAVYREDSQTLYGFQTRDDREFFRLLLSKVSGIGPRIALGILSQLSVPLLKSAIAAGDIGLLAKCRGIGKKTADRLVVELRDHVTPLQIPLADAASGEALVLGQDSRASDSIAALVTLGMKVPAADKLVRRVMSTIGPEVTTEEIIKRALN